MPNLERQITKHNQKVLGDNDKNSNNEERTCHCKIKDECPVNETMLNKRSNKVTVKYNNKNIIWSRKRASGLKLNFCNTNFRVI